MRGRGGSDGDSCRPSERPALRLYRALTGGQDEAIREAGGGETGLHPTPSDHRLAP